MNREYVNIRRRAAARGKYAPLHRHLAALTENLWRASFDEIEQILGFRLPDSARLYPAWWSNGGAHSHVLAWEAAGFRVRPKLRKEVIVFERDRLRGDGAAIRSAVVRSRSRVARPSGRTVAQGFHSVPRATLRRRRTLTILVSGHQRSAPFRFAHGPESARARRVVRRAMIASDPARVSRQIPREYLAAATRP